MSTTNRDGNAAEIFLENPSIWSMSEKVWRARPGLTGVWLDCSKISRIEIHGEARCRSEGGKQREYAACGGPLRGKWHSRRGARRAVHPTVLAGSGKLDVVDETGGADAHGDEDESGASDGS